MIEEVQGRQGKRKRLWLAVALVAALLIALIVPPLVSMSRYKSRITQLISTSLGRPVRLSSVEARLLPLPGFVLTDLTVDEDPAYGTEPVLHANTVTTSIRLFSLWRGRLVIDSISVDEASLNLVRTDEGRWNLDPLFRTAAAKTQAAAGTPAPPPLPFLEATNSRINIKNGSEKLPFSLLNTDASLRQQNSGEWRIQLRGQPVRTDLAHGQTDSGEVRLSAVVHHAAQLRDMPVHLDLEWKEGQLGQLTRLILGSDAGWRGDLTGQLSLDGTAEDAHIKTRLRAEGVHRAEFAPAAPLDFDANCSFVYHHANRAVQNLLCDSPLGNGRIRVAGELPGGDASPRLSVELDRIPVQAGLDALRTVRSNLGPGLEAKGSISGKISYAEITAEPAAPVKPLTAAKARAPKAPAPPPNPLTGSLIVDGFQLTGDGLSAPIQFPKITIEPAATDQSPDQSHALSATVAVPVGAPAPLDLSVRIASHGYQLAVRGQASIQRGRELAHIAGLPNASAFDALAGDPISVELAAQGPWIPAEKATESAAVAATPAAPAASPVPAPPAADSLTGTVTLRNANWKADYLANHLLISQATLRLSDAETRLDPVVFAYGPIKGTGSLALANHCEGSDPCLPVFEVNFGALDASALQAAILGAQEKGTLLSSLLQRLRPAAAPVWPQLQGTVKADSLVLGPLTLRQATATVRMLSNGAHITALDASLLGGHVHAAGSLYTPANEQSKPAYMFEVQLQKLNPAALGQLVGQHWGGAGFDADGKVELSGYSESDLTATAKGRMHFDWQKGSVSGVAPAALAHFDHWTADAAIANGAITLQQNQVQKATQSAAVEASATFGSPAKVAFAAPKEAPAKH